MATVVVAGITLILFPVSELDTGVSSGVLYVLGVLFLASYRGLRVGLAAAVVSALALDYFHATPTGQLGAKSTDDLVAIGALLLTGTVASVIADRARQRAEEAEYRLRLEAKVRRAEAERIRLQEVQASRARVVQAADQERRRVVRDLHDGAQQRLVHTVVTLTLARARLLRHDPGAGELVEEALEHARRATGELRELAHGILPSALVHGGLRDGVDALAARMPVPVELDLPGIRLRPDVEAAAYFVVAEALTNVAKHARASRASVAATIAGGQLEVRVRDDGVGGVKPTGFGIFGMEDRLAALEGRLHVESPPGGGTLIGATIPLSLPA